MDSRVDSGNRIMWKVKSRLASPRFPTAELTPQILKLQNLSVVSRRRGVNVFYFLEPSFGRCFVSVNIHSRRTYASPFERKFLRTVSL